MRTRVPTWVVFAAAAALAGCGHSPVITPPPGPPTISCPAEVSMRGVAGGAGVVTFPAPTTVGGTLPLTVTCTPASGTRFTTGGTPVACLAMDAQGRQATCSFTVTVTPLLIDVKRFIAFGDSITAGENGRPSPLNRFVDFPNLYPVKLEGLLNAEYPDQGIVVLNRGKGAEFVEDGVKRLKDVLEADHGDVLLLLGGYNDLLAECTPDRSASAACGRQIDEVVSGIRECIRIAQVSAYGIKYVFVSTITPPGPLVGTRDRRIAGDAVVRTNAALATMVGTQGAVLVDTYARFVGHEAEYVDEDGLHLRPAGYQAMAQAFFDAIRQAVPGTPGLRSFPSPGRQTVSR